MTTITSNEKMLQGIVSQMDAGGFKIDWKELAEFIGSGNPKSTYEKWRLYKVKVLGLSAGSPTKAAAGKAKIDGAVKKTAKAGGKRKKAVEEEDADAVADASPRRTSRKKVAKQQIQTELEEDEGEAEARDEECEDE